MPGRVLERLSDGTVPVFLSMASIWEISIKVGLGKLTLDRPLAELVGASLGERNVERLRIEDSDIVAYAALAFPNPNHRDPFDRMLVVQAAERGLTLLTQDPALTAFGSFVEGV